MASSLTILKLSFLSESDQEHWYCSPFLLFKVYKSNFTFNGDRLIEFLYGSVRLIDGLPSHLFRHPPPKIESTEDVFLLRSWLSQTELPSMTEISSNEALGFSSQTETLPVTWPEMVLRCVLILGSGKSCVYVYIFPLESARKSFIPQMLSTPLLISLKTYASTSSKY